METNSSGAASETEKIADLPDTSSPAIGNICFEIREKSKMARTTQNSGFVSALSQSS